MNTFCSTLLILPLTLLASGCNAPDPADYGGGAKGEAIAKCVSKTQRADSAVTREQAGEMCTCVTDKTYAALTGGGMNKDKMVSAMLSCAKKAGVEITR
ncbi:MAG: hypothetical protein AAF127_03605 [Pseudomonadota bacterium]